VAVGHAGRTTARKHYTAQDLGRFQRAIEAVQLNVDADAFDITATRTTIVYDEQGLPTVPEWGDCPMTFATPWDHATWATITVERFLSGRFDDESEGRRGWDSNPRMTVLQLEGKAFTSYHGWSRPLVSKAFVRSHQTREDGRVPLEMR
jgi:hypothetical protein